MRRTAVVVSALTAVLLGVSACGGGSDTPTASSSSVSSAPPSAAGAPASVVDRKTTCANFAAMHASAGIKMITATSEFMKADSEVDATKKKEALAKALETMKASTAEYKAGLNKEAAQAGDAEVKALLTSAAAGMTQFDDQLNKITTITSLDDIPDIENKDAEEAMDKLQALCK